MKGFLGPRLGDENLMLTAFPFQMKSSAFIHGEKSQMKCACFLKITQLFPPLSTTLGVRSLSDQLTS